MAASCCNYRRLRHSAKVAVNYMGVSFIPTLRLPAVEAIVTYQQPELLRKLPRLVTDFQTLLGTRHSQISEIPEPEIWGSRDFQILVSIIQILGNLVNNLTLLLTRKLPLFQP